MPGRGAGERLVIDPNNNNVLYLGARSGNGLWKSSDAGLTWKKVTTLTATGTFAQDPSDSSGMLHHRSAIATSLKLNFLPQVITAIRLVLVGLFSILHLHQRPLEPRAYL